MDNETDNTDLDYEEMNTSQETVRGVEESDAELTHSTCSDEEPEKKPQRAPHKTPTRTKHQPRVRTTTRTNNHELNKRQNQHQKKKPTKRQENRKTDSTGRRKKKEKIWNSWTITKVTELKRPTEET